MTVDNATLRKSEFQSVAETVGFCRSLGATLITLSGKDRASFLHNLCTADIKGLAPGAGCELFVTDVRGKTIGFGHAFADSESIILSTAADQADILIPHLNRYLIREDVQFFDQSGNWQQWALCGPQAESFLKEKMGLQIPAKNLSHQTATLEGITLHCCRTDFFEYPGFLLQIESRDCEKLLATFTSVAADCDSSVFEFLRVKAGSPIFGVDITPRNFPQEIDRDAKAISFNKGCYLGQETIARIDALGQVQQLLRQLKFITINDIPLTGTVLEVDGKKAGHITSVSRDPTNDQVAALGMVRRAHATAGTQLACPSGIAEVC